MPRTEHAWWRFGGSRQIAEEYASEVVKRFTGEIASRLGKVSALATTAETINSQGLTKHAFEALMDVEPLIFEATALLNAALIVRRSDREEEVAANLKREAAHRTTCNNLIALCCIAAAAARGRASLANSRRAHTEGPDHD